MRMTQPIPWTTEEIMVAVKGNLLFGNPKNSFTGVSIDSRKISRKNLFVAIEGEAHDGHDFAANAIEQGVRGLVMRRDKAAGLPISQWEESGISCIVVDNTIKALGDLAAFIRRRADVSVVGITGSNGKTTTREMTSQVMARQFDTLTPIGNYNNEIGLPLTLLKLGKNHELAILELGMNRPGEIGRLAGICEPDIGIITNIGPAHLEGVGSMEGVARAKGELLSKIKPDGTAVLNADDPRVLSLAEKTDGHVLLFGISKNAAVRAESIEENDSGTSFILILPTEKVPVRLGVRGKFMVSNALAAAAAGFLMGLSGREMTMGFARFKSVQGRMNTIKTKNGINIINDTYNANPGSMAAALATLRSLKGDARAFFATGDMYELGKYADAMHEKVGALAAGSKIHRLCIAGAHADKVAAGALSGGMNSQNVFKGNRTEIIQDLTASLEPGDWVLVKGSRAMAMEKVVEGIKQWADEN